MRQGYGVISDTHLHEWSAFASTDKDGLNSRLKEILSETVRAAQVTEESGSKVLFHAGDLFHVRGKIAPPVLNAARDVYKSLIDQGFKIYILAGNHDLTGKESDRLGSAITAMEDVGCAPVNQTTVIKLGTEHNVVMVPWYSKVTELKAELERVAAREKDAVKHVDLIIHAPVDGNIPGLPDHGLSAEWLADLGFERVFSGHYHNHKDFGNGVWSIGALTHHNWGDIGAKAGFLTTDDKGVKFNSQITPAFIELTPADDPAEFPFMVPGNYVRIKINSAKPSDVESVRQTLTDLGAVGVQVIPLKSAAAAPRVGATVKAGETMEGSVATYITGAGLASDQGKLNTLCADILATVKASRDHA